MLYIFEDIYILFCKYTYQVIIHQPFVHLPILEIINKLNQTQLFTQIKVNYALLCRLKLLQTTNIEISFLLGGILSTGTDPAMYHHYCVEF